MKRASRAFQVSSSRFQVPAGPCGLENVGAASGREGGLKKGSGFGIFHLHSILKSDLLIF